MNQICYNWEEADFTWNENEYTWDDVCLVLELRGGGHGDFNHWPEEKKKKFITLYAKVKGQTEPELLYELRTTDKVGQITLKDIKVTTEDVTLVIESVLKVNVEI